MPQRVAVVGEATELSALFTKTVEALLEKIPPKYLGGLVSVVLVSGEASGPKGRNKSVSRQERRSMGAYFRGRSGAHIEIYVESFRARYGEDALAKERPRRVAVGMCLLHELGHHISARIEPRHAHREEVAWSWAKKLAPAVLGLEEEESSKADPRQA